MAASRNGDTDTAESAIHIVIVDDHAVLRAGLRLLLDAEPDMMVVGEAGDGTEALARIRDLAPDIALLDLTMPGMAGLDVLRQIRQSCAHTRVLILTMHDDESYLREALSAGCSGYVLKRAADIELLSAIRAVHRGGTYLHAAHTRVLFEQRTNRTIGRTRARPEAHLSSREQQVLQLIALGHTNQQAADKLYLSVKTVETYRARLMAKLGLHHRADLVRYALERQMLNGE